MTMERAMVLLESRLVADFEQRSQRYGNTQFQPNGKVLQMDNWKAGDRLLSVGNFIKLSWRGGMSPDGPTVDRSRTSLEESFLERHQDTVNNQRERHGSAVNAIATIPWSALAERERQEIMLRNSTLASGAAARPLDPTILGDAGLVLARYAPILARMNVMVGVVGDQKLAVLSAQDAPVPAAEGAAITPGIWTFGGTAKQPISIPAAFQMTSSLRAIDDGQFETVVRAGIRDVLQNQVVAQVLNGDGTGNNLSGVWLTTGVVNHDYGAGDADLDRDDLLTVLNSVRLSNTDGSAPMMVASKGLWELLEKKPRGTDGTSSAGYTEIQSFLLDNVMHSNSGVMGMVEGAECHYYSDLSPDGVTNPGLVFKGDRAVVWFWGDSLALEYVPVTSANYFYRVVAEVNCDFELPASNFARIKQT